MWLGRLREFGHNESVPNVYWEEADPTSFKCVLIASKRKTKDSHSRMRTEEKLESAMVEQCVLEIQG